ncbi:unnamed protein product, partial [Urochloa humidicola]
FFFFFFGKALSSFLCSLSSTGLDSFPPPPQRSPRASRRHTPPGSGPGALRDPAYGDGGGAAVVVGGAPAGPPGPRPPSPAVCPWRVGAHPRRHKPLPPPLPWLAVRDGSIVDLHGAPIRRCVPILREGAFHYLAVDNLTFLVHDDGSCSLMNPLSGQTLPLPELAPAVRRAIGSVPAYGQSYIRNGHVKVILPSPPDWTPDPLIP